mgnify:FL=1
MLTPQQETYCVKRCEGLSQRKAFRIAYPRSQGWKDSSVDCNASQLESKAKIAQRIRELQASVADKAILDKSKYLKGLDNLFNASSNVLGASLKMGNGIDQEASRSMRDTAKILLPYAEAMEAKEERPKFCADFALLIQPDFFDFHRRFTTSDDDDYWLTGGRGSCKSSVASLEIVRHLEQNPMEHGLCLMKFSINLRSGVYGQIEWAIDELGVSDHWEGTKSPMELTNTITGQKIYFRGCDDPKKLKSSVKPSFGHVGVVFFEEADLFRGMEEIRNVNQTLSRGGRTRRIYCFNPPRSRLSWVNKHMDELRDAGKTVYSSNYKHVPPEWLGETFLNDAEALREEDEQAYLHEYMGEPVGMGTEVFDRVEFRTITDEEIREFDNPKLGQDFGWYPDPWAFTISEWRQNGRQLLTYYEDGGCKLQPDEQAKRILKALDRFDLHGEFVWSDDASPQSIDAQKAVGVQARKSEKGNMREESYKFLQSAKWVIDPQRCPKLAAEVRAMEYEVTRDGEVLNKIPDGNDHYVDATRYAIMRNARRGRDAYPG